ncbi:MAG TPA: hypothetical protein VIZ68_00515 [Thermoplasmata archaeon]
MRSVHDGVVFDRLGEVARRYIDQRPSRVLGEVWTLHRRPTKVPSGSVLRIQATESFRLHWTIDEWKSVQDTDARSSSLGESYVDVGELPPVGASVRFTFFWPGRSEWEGRDFAVEVGPARSTATPH